MDKNKLKILLFYVLFAACFFGGAALGRLMLPWFYGLIVGGGMLVILSVAAFCVRTRPATFVAVIAFNGFFSGVTASAYYSAFGFPFDYLPSLFVAAGGVALLLLFALLSRTEFLDGHPLAVRLPVCIVILAVCIFLWAFFKLPVFGYITFTALGIIAFMQSLFMTIEENSDIYLWPLLASLFIPIFIAAILILFGMLEGYTPGTDTSKANSKKQRRK